MIVLQNPCSHSDRHTSLVTLCSKVSTLYAKFFHESSWSIKMRVMLTLLKLPEADIEKMTRYIKLRYGVELSRQSQ